MKALLIFLLSLSSVFCNYYDLNQAFINVAKKSYNKSISKVANLKDYAANASKAIKKYNGKILVRGGKTETLEGLASPRTVLIEFPSTEEALNFYHSEEYQAAMKIGGKFNRSIQIVEGT